MRKLSNLLLVALLIGYVAPFYAQSSTEGKEFWVGLTMAIRPPGDGDGEASPYLAISTKEKTVVQFSNPAFPSETMTETIDAFQWKKIDIPQKWWYPTGVGKPSKVKEHADEVNNYGVYVKADNNISVFAVIRAGAGMDASNILPITALQTEYILQDYIPHAKEGGMDKDAPYTTMATIVATEDNTEITVKPKGTLLKATTPRLVNNKITLNKGQTYYLMAENSGTDHNCLSGTEITSNKKIAVFQGVPCTFIPHDVGNRDCLYEQAMPIDYWGTEFIATRSYAKGANIVRITASNAGKKTDITVNGHYLASIDRGETYEIELASNTSDRMNNSDKKTLNSDTRIVGEYVHIKTSCPSAVYSYDCGKGYTDKDKTETNPDGKQEGDPSSVWIAPMEQSIKQITFGACGTKSDGGNQTKYHYLDIVVETTSIDSTILYSYLDQAPMDIKGAFKPVGGTKYSYARIYLAEADHTKNAVFTVSNPNGLVAHVYGNGESESYAYSAGSAAVEYGVILEGETFTDGYRSNNKFCLGTELKFDAKVGTDEVTSVNWDFGDGTTEYKGNPVITHIYNTPGWYDVTAELFGKHVCTDEDDVPLGLISFTFRVWQAETKIGDVKHICIEADSTLDGIKLRPDELEKLLLYGKPDTIKPKPGNCADDTIINYETYGIETKVRKDTIHGEDQATGYNGKIYYKSTEVEDTTTNEYNCPHYTRYYVHVKTCLSMTMDNGSSVCPGKNLELTYTKTKGTIQNPVRFVVKGVLDTTFFMSNEDTPVGSLSELILPTAGITKPGHYHAELSIDDAEKCSTQTFPIDFAVTYPENIFDFKFSNVLAVRKDAGYNFIHYQWYINDKPIGDDVSVLYLGENVALIENQDVVYVKLTDQSGMVLESCPKTIKYKDGSQLKPNKAPSARKVLQNQRLYILRDEEIYDIYGQKVK